MLKLNRDYLITTILVIFILILSSFEFVEEKKFLIEIPNNVFFDRNKDILYFNSLTLKQKIAQMIITFGSEENKEILQNMLVGGIYLGAKPSKEDYIKTINFFQEDSIIPFLVTVDMEGCLNPFENFQKFPSLREIDNVDEAYEAGYEEGELLRELGFNINFAPVVDLEDSIWNCRNFGGTAVEVADKANAYIKGLQLHGIIATSKHYPGKTLVVKDPHRYLTYASIDDEDLLPFRETIKNNVSAIMISHIIVNGSVNSELKPAVVSSRLVGNLRGEFNGLILTDEIRMLGLRQYYADIDEMYVDLFKSNNDLILNFDTNLKNLYYMIKVIEDAVERREISEERIDKSVVKILKAKGINVIYSAGLKFFTIAFQSREYSNRHQGRILKSVAIG